MADGQPYWPWHTLRGQRAGAASKDVIVKICSECRSTRFGLVRHRWGAHQFCRKECLQRFKRRLEAEVKRRKFIAWLSGRAN